MKPKKKKKSGNGHVESHPITPEDRRAAIEHALQRTEPIFHLTEGQVAHIGEIYRRRR